MDIEDSAIKEFLESIKKSNNIDEILDKNGAFGRLFKHTVEGMLDAELTHHLGYDKNDQEGNNSGNSRNGKSSKKIKSSYGELPIEIPRDRNASFEPEVVKKGQRNVGVLDNMVISLYAKGLSTRDITSHLKEIYDIDVSAEKISMITDRIKSLALEWQSRALENCYVICYFDAIHFKVKHAGRVVSKAAYTCLGIDSRGHKNLLGIWIGESEGAHFWLNVLTDIKNRGVNDILISCVDGLKGFPEALNTIFPNTEVQVCVIHQIRNSLKYIASKNQKPFMKDLKLVYKASTIEQAEEEMNALDEKWGRQYPLVIKSWRNNWENLTRYFKYSPEIRKLIYTTNMVENLHRQFRKITKTKSVFPNNDSLVKIIYLAYTDLSKKWNRPIHLWGSIISQFSIHFEGRIELDI